MILADEIPKIPLTTTRDCLVATLPVDLSEEVIRNFQGDLLDRLHRQRFEGVVLDLSAVDILDSETFEQTRRTARMVELMGVSVLMVGFRPGVVASLIGLGVDLEGVDAARDLEDALSLLLPAEKIEPSEGQVVEELENLDEP